MDLISDVTSWNVINKNFDDIVLDRSEKLLTISRLLEDTQNSADRVSGGDFNQIHKFLDYPRAQIPDML